ncbi:hypothetical protein Fcan01_00456 [Folsomia candida]|uniref:Uncharacterized protein n=1 Tax=Folsomia candida TaxID=158441 RepID=A0A226F355_FOLCA|nr:hypothetical protein Fcan01_00456 [Folsomia candida]
MFLTYQEYSRRMQHFTSPPIEWCHIKKKFVFVSGQFKSYLWYFHIFVGLGFCTVGGLIVILLSQIFKFYQAFHAVYIFIFVVQLSSGGAIFAMNLGMMLYGSDCVQERRRDQPDSSSRSLLWITMTGFIWAFTTYPLLLSVSAIFFQLDRYGHILSMLKITNPLLHIFRFYLIVTGPAELCRSLALVILFSISTFHMLRNTLKALIKGNSTRFLVILARMRGTLVESQYRQVQIIVVSMEALLGCICLFAQGLGLANGVLCNFASLKLYTTVPIWIYTIYPCVAVMILITIHVTMPCLHNVLDFSEKLLKILTLFSILRLMEARKISHKQLKSMKNITISPILAGYKFFIYRRCTKVTYLVMFVTHTINLLLTVPQDVIERAAYLF